MDGYYHGEPQDRDPPLFTASMAVLPAILSELPEASPFTAIASAGVGGLILVVCNIHIENEYALNTYVQASYFYSPTQFDYKGGKYYMGSLYVDALIGSS